MPAGGQTRRMLAAGGRNRKPGRGAGLFRRVLDLVGALAARWAGLTSRTRWTLASCALAVVVALVVLGLSGNGGPPARARIYIAFTACLLTDGTGLAGHDAAATWAGMEEASLATHAKVQLRASDDRHH